MLEKIFSKRRFLFFGVSIFLFSCSQKIIAPEEILGDLETKQLIENLLTINSPKYKTLKKNALLSLGEKGKFQVDYLITKKDETNAVINYIEEDDNSAREFSNQKILKEYSIPNVYLEPGTEREINLSIKNFINRSFN